MSSVSHSALQPVQAALATKGFAGSVVLQGGCCSSQMTPVLLRGGGTSSHVASVAPVLLQGGQPPRGTGAGLTA